MRETKRELRQIERERGRGEMERNFIKK